MADEVLSQEEMDALTSAGDDKPAEGDQSESAEAAAGETAEQAPDAQEEEEGSAQPQITVQSEPEPAVRPADLTPLTHSANPRARSGMELILDVNLSVAVELGRTTMRVKEVLALGPGSVVELNKSAGEPVEVVVNNKTVARGEVVVIDENFGVRITEIVSGKAGKSDAKAA